MGREAYLQEHGPHTLALLGRDEGVAGLIPGLLCSAKHSLDLLDASNAQGRASMPIKWEWICPCLQEQLHTLRAALRRCKVEGTPAQPIKCEWVSPCLQEQLHALRAALLRCTVEGTPAPLLQSGAKGVGEEEV